MRPQRWFFLSDKQEQIPTSEDQIRSLAYNGIVRPQTLVWREGLTEWVSAGELKPELFSGLGAAPTPTGPVEDAPITNPASVGPRQAVGVPPIPTVRTGGMVRSILENLAVRTPWMHATAALWMLLSLVMAVASIVRLAAILLASAASEQGVDGAPNERTAATVALMTAKTGYKFQVIGTSIFFLMLYLLLLWMGATLFRAASRLKSGHLRADAAEIETGASLLGSWFVRLTVLTLLFMGYLLFRIISGLGLV
ncbi:MAG: DUF4339 domain-containing protein [Verrucomicrobiales bacterium]|nr:DUF4339 domain-containing protein [Verrucomicrobiales bacterium]